MQLDLFGRLGDLGIRLGPETPVVVVVIQGDGTQLRARPPRRAAFAVDDAEARRAVEFVDALESGALGHGQAAVLPCASADLYRWYRLWCERSSMPALILSRFAWSLKQGGRVDLRRRRFLGPDGTPSQASVVLARPEHWHISGASLGSSVANFRLALAEYEGQP